MSSGLDKVEKIDLDKVQIEMPATEEERRADARGKPIRQTAEATPGSNDAGRIREDDPMKALQESEVKASRAAEVLGRFPKAVPCPSRQSPLRRGSFSSAHALLPRRSTTSCSRAPARVELRAISSGNASDRGRAPSGVEASRGRLARACTGARPSPPAARRTRHHRRIPV